MGEQERGLVIVETKQFIKSFEQLPARIQKMVLYKINVFRQYPAHAGLHVHKLEGKQKNKWSFWVNYEYRIIYYKYDEYFLFDDVGTHEIYK